MILHTVLIIACTLSTLFVVHACASGSSLGSQRSAPLRSASLRRRQWSGTDNSAATSPRYSSPQSGVSLADPTTAIELPPQAESFAYRWIRHMTDDAPLAPHSLHVLLSHPPQGINGPTRLIVGRVAWQRPETRHVVAVRNSSGCGIELGVECPRSGLSWDDADGRRHFEAQALRLEARTSRQFLMGPVSLTDIKLHRTEYLGQAPPQLNPRHIAEQVVWNGANSNRDFLNAMIAALLGVRLQRSRLARVVTAVR